MWEADTMIRMQRPKLAQILSVYTKKLLAVGAPGPHSNYCLSLYLDIAGILQHPGEMLLPWGPGEILVTESSHPVTYCMAAGEGNI